MNRDNLEGLVWSVIVVAMVSLGATHGAQLAHADRMRIEAQLGSPGHKTRVANPHPTAGAAPQDGYSAGGYWDWMQGWAMP